MAVARDVAVQLFAAHRAANTVDNMPPVFPILWLECGSGSNKQ